jgi:hypothetical protein
MNNKNIVQTGKKWKLAVGAIALVAIVEAFHHLPHCSKKIEGEYAGVIPCADCSGIRETLTLKDGKYNMKLEYLGKGDTTAEFEGGYKVAKCGTITLEGSGDGPDSFRMAGKDALLHLDMDNKPIESEFNYVLVRQ